MWCFLVLFSFLTFIQEGFGCAKPEVEIYADGEVSSVVGDIEAKQFFVFAFFFVVKQGKYKTAVNIVIIGFKIFLSPVDEGLLFHFLACRHREMDALSYSVMGGIEGTGKGEDGEHVIIAFI